MTEDLPRLEFADPGPVRDEVVAAILAGTKTTTTGLALEYERAGTAMPDAGQQFVVVDSDSRPAAVIEMTEVRKVPIAAIDLRHVLGDPGFTVGDDTVVLAQRFGLVRVLSG